MIAALCSRYECDGGRWFPPRMGNFVLRQTEHDTVSNDAMIDGIAATIRGFIERQFGIPASKLTTEELLVAAERAAWPVEHSDSIQRLLGECDRAKFAGNVPDNDGCRSLLARGRDWVDLVCPYAGPR